MPIGLGPVDNRNFQPVREIQRITQYAAKGKDFFHKACHVLIKPCGTSALPRRDLSVVCA
jgi:hypothetical protein